MPDSYKCKLTVTNGAAIGLTLQLGGTGTLYEQLAWAAPSAGSQGSITTAATPSRPCPAEPWAWVT